MAYMSTLTPPDTRLSEIRSNLSFAFSRPDLLLPSKLNTDFKLFLNSLDSPKRGYSTILKKARLDRLSSMKEAVDLLEAKPDSPTKDELIDIFNLCLRSLTSRAQITRMYRRYKIFNISMMVFFSFLAFCITFILPRYL